MSACDHGNHLGADDIVEMQDRPDVEHHRIARTGEADKLDADGLFVAMNLAMRA
ncbi:hypothetical protein ACH495_25615 [Micromonospora sp. NPDC018662]|uniref:hypothetical protein n=1 Tax=Micromonospora sp. NPDC018662 TaxID=3364238 RepID=UPI00378C22C4